MSDMIEQLNNSGFRSQRIQIKINRGKRCRGQNAGAFHTQGFWLSSPSGGVDSAHFCSKDM